MTITEETVSISTPTDDMQTLVSRPATVYHEPEPAGTVIPLDQAGADKGNADKIARAISSCDGDARALDYLAARPDASGKPHRRAESHMRSDSDPLHAKAAWAKAMNGGSLARAGEISRRTPAHLGRQDPHVPLEGRNLIHARRAFLRDEGPRYDPELARTCLGLAPDLFHRKLR
jgi:carboxymethylenebutenolidase